MVILCFGPAQQDCNVFIIFIHSYIYIYIYISIIYIHFSFIIHCFPPSSLILFNPCSSILIKSFHACSIFPFPSNFHPFFILFSFLHQCLSNFIHRHPLFTHISSIFFIHFHPFFMCRHRCSSIFALVMLSSIYNPVIFHFHPVASVHTALERSLFYRIPQRFPNGHSMFRSGTARL